MADYKGCYFRYSKAIHLWADILIIKQVPLFGELSFKKEKEKKGKEIPILQKEIKLPKYSFQLTGRWMLPFLILIHPLARYLEMTKVMLFYILRSEEAF